MQQHHHQLPNAAALASMTVDELMDVTLRLSDILTEESELISAMRYKELPKLHEEKMKLAVVLEAYQNRLVSDPDFVRSANPKTREELLLRTDDLAFSVEENFRKVSVAKAVNNRVMQAMVDVMSEQHRPGTYGPSGYATQSNDLALSVNLNQQA